MNIAWQELFLLLFSFSLVAVVWQLTKRDKLRPAYALLWLGTSVSFLGLLVLRPVILRISEVLHVGHPTSLLFAVAFIFLLVLLLQQSVVASTLAKKNAELAERIAITQWRMERLESRILEYNVYGPEVINEPQFVIDDNRVTVSGPALVASAAD